MPSRPDSNTMEGMIYNANEALEQALSPGVTGIPKNLFEDAEAIAIFNVTEIGLLISRNVGSGIMMVSKSNGTWSPPNAMALTGMGCGLLVGGSVKNIIVFFMDDNAVNAALTDSGFKLGGQAEITLGMGRTGAADVNLAAAGSDGASSTISIAFTKGAFMGLSMEGATVRTNSEVNQKFYDGEQPKTPRDILLGNNVVKIPSDKVAMMNEVYDKLAQLMEPSMDDD